MSQDLRTTFELEKIYSAVENEETDLRHIIKYKLHYWDSQSIRFQKRWIVFLVRNKQIMVELPAND